MKKVFVMQQFLKGITSVINKLEFIWFLVFCGIFVWFWFSYFLLHSKNSCCNSGGEVA